MESIHKKATIVYVLKMLNEGSDELHPISQVTMTKTLAMLGIICNRKTISRDIECLIECGYNIVKVAGKGVYLKKNDLTREDVELLIKGLNCLNIQDKQKDNIKAKLNNFFKY